MANPDASPAAPWPPEVLAAFGENRELAPGTGDLLRALWERGRTAWPTVVVEPGAWGCLLVEVVKTNGPPTVDDVSRLHAEDFYLACGCALGEPQALAAFDRSYLSQLPVLLGHMRLSNAVIGEVGQVLREKLLVGTGDRPARIRLYSGQGSLLGWLRVVATRAALNLGDAQDEKNVGDSGAVDALMTSQTPERALIMQQQRHDLLAILRDAIRTLPTEQRQALRMQMCDGLTGDDIAARLSVTRSTVVRWLSAAREATLKETERLFRQRLDLSGVEVEQVVAETRSHLDLRLSQLFRSAPDGEGVP